MGTVNTALLGDFHDADTETTPDDAAIVDAATRIVEALNARHGADRFRPARGFDHGPGLDVADPGSRRRAR